MFLPHVNKTIYGALNVGAPHDERLHPREPILRPTIIVAIGTVILTALHAAFLETGVRSRTGTSRCDRVSQSTLSRHRAPIDRRASPVLRSGNPRRRFDVRSKAVEGVLSFVLGHTASL